MKRIITLLIISLLVIATAHQVTLWRELSALNRRLDLLESKVVHERINMQGLQKAIWEVGK